MSLFECLSLLLESKDHIINKMPKLSDDEKKAVIYFFKKKPNLENKIDWNRWKELTLKDFQDVMAVTKTEKKKKVKQTGIAGLKKGEDYLEFPLPESVDAVAYAPLSHEASEHIASKSIGGCEGKWCTAYHKNAQYWDKYTNKGIILIYIIGPDKPLTHYADNSVKMTKYALAIYPGGKVEIFNQMDSSMSKENFKSESGIDADKDILAKKTELNKVREAMPEPKVAELSEERLKQIGDNFADSVGLEESEKGKAAARDMVREEHDGMVETYAEPIGEHGWGGLDVDQLEYSLNENLGEWEYAFEQIMKFMVENHGVDPDSEKNKLNALYRCNAGDSTPKKDSYVETDLLEMDWEYRWKETVGEMISRFEYEIDDFDDIPDGFLETWLTHNYNKRPEEFAIFKKDFITLFEDKIKKLTDKEKEYITDLIDKVASVEYGKAGHPSLFDKKKKAKEKAKAESVSRYLHAVING